MVCENCSVSRVLTSEILVLESPREARFANSAEIVCWKNKIVLANHGLVDGLCFVAGQSEVVIDPEGKHLM